MNANLALETTVKTLFDLSFDVLFYKIKDQCEKGETSLVVDGAGEFFQQWLNSYNGNNVDDAMNILIRYLESINYRTEVFYGTYKYSPDDVNAPTTNESRYILIIKW